MANRRPVTIFLVTYFLYPLQAILILSIYYGLRFLPLSTATGIGSFIFRKLGRRMRVASIAEQNVRRVFPNLKDAEVDSLLNKIWHNLGQGAVEFAHLDRLKANGENARVELLGKEHLDTLIRSPSSGIIVSAHMGNWELGARVVGHIIPSLGQIYRGADNPFIDRLFRNVRSTKGTILVPKGRGGAAQMLRLMKQGVDFGVMMDQKMNEGVPVPFFGVEAMTATAPVEVVWRSGGLIVMVRCIRLPNSHFKIEVLPPLEFQRTTDRKADVLSILKQINSIIEEWIREYPEQWFWLHRRWPTD